MTELAEIKTLLDDQGRTWEEFKQKNDELLAAKAEGKAFAEMKEIVDRILADMQKQDGEIGELLKKANRPQLLDKAGKALSPERAEYKAAFSKYLRTGADSGLDDLQRKAYNAGSGPDGGYLVDYEMDTEIRRIVSVVSAIGRISRNVTIGTDSFRKVAKTAGLSARRVGPGATGGETTNAKYAELLFTAHEAEAEPWVFNSTLDDAVIDLEADIAMEAGIAFAELAGSEFAVGSGVGGARGITAYDVVANASYAWGKIGYAFTGVSGGFHATLPGDNIVNLQHALKSQYRPNARFVMSDATLAQVRQMKDGSGNYYLWQPDPLVGFGGVLLGSPVEIDDNMPVIAANSLSIAYGDFMQAYLIVNRQGTMVIRDNITAKGKTKFNFRARWGGGIASYEAIKLLKFGTS